MFTNISHKYKSKNFDNRKKKISFIIIHYTETKNLKKAISLLKKSKEWPENLGVGKPYNTDERIQDYLLYYCNFKIQEEKADKYLQKIINYCLQILVRISSYIYFSICD